MRSKLKEKTLLWSQLVTSCEIQLLQKHVSFLTHTHTHTHPSMTYLFGEDVLQREAERGSQSADESWNIKGQLSGGGQQHSSDDGDERHVHLRPHTQREESAETETHIAAVYTQNSKTCIGECFPINTHLWIFRSRQLWQMFSPIYRKVCTAVTWTSHHHSKSDRLTAWSVSSECQHLLFNCSQSPVPLPASFIRVLRPLLCGRAELFELKIWWRHWSFHIIFLALWG